MPLRAVFLSAILVASSGLLAYSSKSSFQNNYTKTLGASAATSHNLPPELKLPTDAKIISSINGRQGSQITIETAASREAVINLIDNSLESSGWRKVSAEKLTKNGQSLNLQITPQNETNLTIVTISYLLAS